MLTDGGRVVHSAFAGPGSQDASPAAPSGEADVAQASESTEPGLDAAPPPKRKAGAKSARPKGEA